jgi:hypothetical protein
MQVKFLIRNTKLRHHFGDKDVDGREMLQRILEVKAVGSALGSAGLERA